MRPAGKRFYLQGRTRAGGTEGTMELIGPPVARLDDSRGRRERHGLIVANGPLLSRLTLEIGVNVALIGQCRRFVPRRRSLECTHGHDNLIFALGDDPEIDAVAP